MAKPPNRIFIQNRRPGGTSDGAQIPPPNDTTTYQEYTHDPLTNTQAWVDARKDGWAVANIPALLAIPEPYLAEGRTVTVVSEESQFMYLGTWTGTITDWRDIGKYDHALPEHTDVSDTATSTAIADEVLTYNAVSSEWENQYKTAVTTSFDPSRLPTTIVTGGEEQTAIEQIDQQVQSNTDEIAIIKRGSIWACNVDCTTDNAEVITYVTGAGAASTPQFVVASPLPAAALTIDTYYARVVVAGLFQGAAVAVGDWVICDGLTPSWVVLPNADVIMGAWHELTDSAVSGIGQPEGSVIIRNGASQYETSWPVFFAERFAWVSETDATKRVEFDHSDQATATTRTISTGDTDIDLKDVVTTWGATGNTRNFLAGSKVDYQNQIWRADVDHQGVWDAGNFSMLSGGATPSLWVNFTTSRATLAARIYGLMTWGAGSFTQANRMTSNRILVAFTATIGADTYLSTHTVDLGVHPDGYVGGTGEKGSISCRSYATSYTDDLITSLSIGSNALNASSLYLNFSLGVAVDNLEVDMWFLERATTLTTPAGIAIEIGGESNVIDSWTPADGTGGGLPPHSLDDHTDVSIVSPS